MPAKCSHIKKFHANIAQFVFISYFFYSITYTFLYKSVMFKRNHNYTTSFSNFLPSLGMYRCLPKRGANGGDLCDIKSVAISLVSWYHLSPLYVDGAFNISSPDSLPKRGVKSLLPPVNNKYKASFRWCIH